ncbi:MAG: hypothetical protein HOP19_06345, partial [Acidobacteria bacterium]|nr:hypothetical protein [Acidobacteriota bacterium]
FTPSYSYEGDLFRLLGATRWEANDYSLGLDATYRNWTFFAEQMYRSFRNDPQIGALPNDPGANLPPAPTTALAFLERDTPLRSHAAVTRGSVAGTIGERIQVSLRGLRDEERMRAPYYEISNGTGRNNARIITRVLTADGFVKRPNSVVDAAASFDLNQHFTLNDSFRYSGFRILGDVNTLLNFQTQTGTANSTTVITNTVGNRLTDYTSYWNTLSLQMSYGKRFSANLGWRAMLRDVTLNGLYTSRASNTTTVTTTPQDESESIGTHAFVGGFRVRPTNRMSFIFDTEHGTSNNAFIRINPLEYTRFRIRTQIQATDKLSFTGVVTTTDRTNPTPQVSNDSNMRSYTTAVNWEPNHRAWLNVGYDYHDLYSTANIRYFLAGNVLKTGRSLYYARLNTLFVNARFGLTQRLDALLVYYYLMDRGAPPVSVGPDDLVTALPLRRHNPEARLAFRFNHFITGNLSYRHYSYNEREFAVQDYRSNILTSSLRFTF